MEVSGRKVFNEEENLLCKPCEERGLTARAEGLCMQCDELVCRPCFETHKQWKINRGHRMANPDEAVTTRDETEDLVKCDEHSGELIKFYCPQHEQVGCGDCMILEHKSCKVEYIRDKARTFKGSQEFRDLIKGAEKVQLEAKQMLSSVKNNKAQVNDINAKFNRDVNMFKEEMMSYITKLTNAMLKQGEDIKATNNKSLDEIERENETLMNEVSRLTQLLESQTDQPQKLFVSSISEKPKLNRLRGQLDNIKGKNKIEMYEFIRDVNLERSVKDVKNLGSLQKMKPRKETVEQEVRPKKTSQVPQVPVPPKPQPLFDRQLICRNITVNGEYLSYADNGRGDDGLYGMYVDKNKVRKGSYFEVEILSMGQRGTIAIGLVPDGYPENQQLGWGEDSIGYHADDGKLYNESGSGVRFGSKCNAGDKIGCGIIDDLVCWTVVFTRNGKRIGEKEIFWLERLFPAVGMHSAGEKVKVILDAKMPRM